MSRVLRRVTGRLPLLLWLTAVWVGLWGSLTWANLLGGLAVSAGLLALLPLRDVPGSATVRPLPLARFVGFFLVDLVKSSVQVVVLVLRPRGQLRQAVIAVPVRGATDQLITLLANVISLTPGTLTLEVDRPRSTLYVHVIDVGEGPDGVQKIRDEIRHIEELAIRAVGSDESRTALAKDSS